MADDYDGLPVREVGNRFLRLEFLASAGPRLVRLFLAGSGTNQLAEVPEAKKDTPYGPFFFRGGHRLWYAPEAMPRTYIPDNSGLDVVDLPDGVRLTGPVERETGIRKSIEVHLYADRPALTLRHELRNEGLWAVELAPWAITQLPLGGWAVMPQRVPPINPEDLLPDRHLVLWPYTRVNDPRLNLGDETIVIRGEAQMPPCKVGTFNPAGWVGYLRDGMFFCKRFEPRPGQPHPDFGCNAEVYCGDRFIEVESLGPLVRLEPDHSVIHIETWEFSTGVEVPQSAQEARRIAGQLLQEEGEPSTRSSDSITG